MKSKQKNTITLKKLTIAKINQNTMTKIKGGDCDVTEPDTGTHWSHCNCPNVF
ncbi:TIGR04149 family rSAM-modified RiPP [Aquimarina sp. M1]